MDVKTGSASVQYASVGVKVLSVCPWISAIVRNCCIFDDGNQQAGVLKAKQFMEIEDLSDAADAVS